MEIRVSGNSIVQRLGVVTENNLVYEVPEHSSSDYFLWFYAKQNRVNEFKRSLQDFDNDNPSKFMGVQNKLEKHPFKQTSIFQLLFSPMESA